MPCLQFPVFSEGGFKRATVGFFMSGLATFSLPLDGAFLPFQEELTFVCLTALQHETPEYRCLFCA